MTHNNHNGFLRSSAKTKIIIAMAGAGELSEHEIRKAAELWWWEPLPLYLYALEKDGAVKGRGMWPFRKYRLSV